MHLSRVAVSKGGKKQLISKKSIMSTKSTGQKKIQKSPRHAKQNSRAFVFLKFARTFVFDTYFRQKSISAFHDCLFNFPRGFIEEPKINDSYRGCAVIEGAVIEGVLYSVFFGGS